jgi:hypothetical protein
MPAAMSIQDKMVPPKQVPTMLVCWGKTSSVMMTSLVATDLAGTVETLADMAGLVPPVGAALAGYDASWSEATPAAKRPVIR